MYLIKIQIDSFYSLFHKKAGFDDSEIGAVGMR